MKLTPDGIVHTFEIMASGWRKYAADRTETGPLNENYRAAVQTCADSLDEKIAEIRATAAEQTAATQFTRNRAAELLAEYRAFQAMPADERAFSILRGDFSTDTWSARAYTILEELTRDA